MNLSFTLVVLALSTFSPAGSEGTRTGVTVPARAGGPSLGLPEPSLDGMEASVIEAVHARREELARLLADPSSSAEARAEAYGRLGKVYHAHKLIEAASRCYAEARKLEPREARWPYLAGLAQSEAAELEAAEKSFEAVVALRPGELSALLRLGETRLLLDRVDEAEEAFRRARDIDPESAAALAGLGRIAALRKEDEKARDLLLRALELQPEATRLHSPLAQVYRRLGDREEARRQAELFGDTDVVFPEPLLAELMGASANLDNDLELANRALRKGGADLAADLYRKVLTLEPENAAAHAGLAAALDSQGRLEEAMESYREAVRLQPDNPLTRGNYASVLVRLGESDEAMRQLEEALRLDPENREQHLKLAWLLENQGRAEEALVHYRSVLAVSEDDAYALFRAGLLLKQLGDLGPASERLSRLVELEPENMNARVVLASVLAESGRLDQADQQLDRAMELEGEDSVRGLAHLTRGTVLAQRGEKERAIAELDKALDFDLSLTRARFLIANLLASDGRFAEAAAQYDEILLLEPHNLPVRIARVTAAVLVGDFESAQRLLEEGLERAPDQPDLTNALAHLLATCPDSARRNGERALGLSQKAFEAFPSLQNGETLGMALAEVGRFEEAAQWQTKLLQEARRQKKGELAERFQANLDRYRNGEKSLPLWLLPDS